MPFSVVVFDESEKAHPEIWKQLYPLFDEGYLIDSKGRKADFSNSVIILTSNLGSAFIDGKEALDPRTKALVNKAVASHFPAAFLGRVDGKIVADPLSRDNLRDVVGIHLKPLAKELEKRDIGLEVTDNAKALIAATGYKPEWGARPVKDNIRTMIKSPLSTPLLEGKLTEGKTVFVDVDETGEKLAFQYVDSKKPMPAARDITVDYDAIAAKTANADNDAMASDATAEEMAKALQGANDGSNVGPSPAPQAAPSKI
jgi:ATP-dependent Clp protease ATP-binding subunit ClpA